MKNRICCRRSPYQRKLFSHLLITFGEGFAVQNSTLRIEN